MLLNLLLKLSILLALFDRTNDALWFSQLLHQLPMASQLCADPITIREDNQSCIAIAKQLTSTKHSKPIHIRYHFIRYLVQKNKVKLDFCPTEEMIADLLTKEFGGIKFQLLRNKIGVIDVADISPKGGDC